jgi:hypothetical protein
VRLCLTFLALFAVMKVFLWLASWAYSTESAVFGAGVASLLESYNREERAEELEGILRRQQHLDGLHCHSARTDCVAKCVCALHDELLVSVLKDYPRSTLSEGAALHIQKLCHFITVLVSEEMLDKRAKIQIGDIERALLRTLPKNLHVKSIAAGSTAIEHFRQSAWAQRAANVRVSIAAGLFLSVEHIKQWMDKALSVQQQFGWALVDVEGAIFLAAVLQYIAADTLEHTVEYMAIARRSKTDMRCMQPEFIGAAMMMSHSDHLHQLYTAFAGHQAEVGEDETADEETEELAAASVPRARRRQMPVLAAEEPVHM